MYIFFLYVIYTKHCNIESSQKKTKEKKKEEGKKKTSQTTIFVQHCISNYTQGHAYKVSTQGVLFIFLHSLRQVKMKIYKRVSMRKRGLDNNMAASGWSRGLRGIGEVIKRFENKKMEI